MLAVVSIQTDPVAAALIVGNGSLSDVGTDDGKSFGGHQGYGMKFTMGGTSDTVKFAGVMMKSTIATSKTFNARIYAASDILLNSPTPVISSSFVASFASAGTQWFTVDFGSGANLSASAGYIFAIEEATAEDTPAISWVQPTSSKSYSSPTGVGVTSSPYYERFDINTNQYLSTTSNPLNLGFQLYTEAVPEPSSLALMGMGLASVAAAARKARKKKVATAGA